MTTTASSDTILSGSDLYVDITARDRDSIAALMTHLTRISKASQDVVLPTSQMSATPNPDFPVDPHLTLRTPSQFAPDIIMASDYPVRVGAQRQLAAVCDIPWSYFSKLRDSDRALWASNVNRWIDTDKDRRFVRILDGQIRAILSPSYLPLNSEDLFLVAYRAAQSLGAEINRAQLSENRFSLSIVNTEWKESVYTDSRNFTRPVDSAVCPLVSVSNSDTGQGGLKVNSGIFTMICRNNMVWSNVSKRRHISSAALDGWNVDTDVRRLAAQTVWAQVSAAIRDAFDPKLFTAKVAALRNASDTMIEEPDKAVEYLGTAYAFSDTERSAILNEFASPRRNPHDASVLGLINAITSYAQDVSVDRGQELEEIAGQLVTARLPAVVRTGKRDGRAV